MITGLELYKRVKSKFSIRKLFEISTDNLKKELSNEIHYRIMIKNGGNYLYKFNSLEYYNVVENALDKLFYSEKDKILDKIRTTQLYTEEEAIKLNIQSNNTYNNSNTFNTYNDHRSINFNKNDKYKQVNNKTLKLVNPNDRYRLE